MREAANGARAARPCFTMQMLARGPPVWRRASGPHQHHRRPRPRRRQHRRQHRRPAHRLQGCPEAPLQPAHHPPAARVSSRRLPLPDWLLLLERPHSASVSARLACLRNQVHVGARVHASAAAAGRRRPPHAPPFFLRRRAPRLAVTAPQLAWRHLDARSTHAHAHAHAAERGGHERA
jgi:hypothetical protein